MRGWTVIVAVVLLLGACGSGGKSSAGTSAPTGVPTTLAPPPPPPTRADIVATMAKTVEVARPSVHFAPYGDDVVIDDGNGGSFSAQGGLKTPSGDGSGQIVFFWHNATFVGWSTDQEANHITGIADGGNGSYVLTYDNYAVGDRMCCPSGAPVMITYKWNGSAFVPSTPPPAGVFGHTVIKVRQTP